MTVTYRNSGDWGAGKGSVLTSTEVDNNFWTLQQLIDDLNSTGGLVSWDSATISGNVLTFHKTDGTTSSVTIPTASPVWRGEFAVTSYAVFDWFFESSALYSVLVAHTSEAPFDAGRIISGQSVYQKLLDFPLIVGHEITDTAFTPTLNYANSYIRCTNVDGCAVSIPTNADAAFPLWTEMHFRDSSGLTSGAGLLTIEAATPATTTLNIPFGYEAQAAVQGAVIGIKKIATDEWDVFGLLASTSI